MTSSRWHAHGNLYIVHEGEGAGVDATGTDGVLEVLAAGGDHVTIGILNTDGSRAEMSGNGTRIAAAWLMARTGARLVHVHVGPRTVVVRSVGDGLYESSSSPSRSGTRTRSSSTTRGASGNSARCSRRTRASRTARTSRSRGSTAPAR